MLFEMTSTLSCWACMPSAAVVRDLIPILPSDRDDRFPSSVRGDGADRVQLALMFLIQELLHRLIIARDLDHAGHLHDGLNVGVFQHATQDLGGAAIGGSAGDWQADIG